MRLQDHMHFLRKTWGEYVSGPSPYLSASENDYPDQLALDGHFTLAQLKTLVAVWESPEYAAPSTDRPELRTRRLGPCTAHDAFSTACLEDGDQYLP